MLVQERLLQWDPYRPKDLQTGDVPGQVRRVKEPCLSWIFASWELLFKAYNSPT